MASEDVLERALKAQRMIPRVVDIFEQAVFIGSVVDDLAAEIERLRADLVWLSRRTKRWDGTPESICRAVREARDGVS